MLQVPRACHDSETTPLHAKPLPSPFSSGSSVTDTSSRPSGIASTMVTVSAGWLALLVTPTSRRYSRMLPAFCTVLGDTVFFTHTSTIDWQQVSTDGLRDSSASGL